MNILYVRKCTLAALLLPIQSIVVLAQQTPAPPASAASSQLVNDVALVCLSGCSGCAPLQTTFQVNFNLPAACAPYDVTVSDGNQTQTFTGVSSSQTFTVSNAASGSWSITGFTASGSCPVTPVIGPPVAITVYPKPEFDDFFIEFCANHVLTLNTLPYTGQNTAGCTYVFYSGLPPGPANQIAPQVVPEADTVYYAVGTSSHGCKDTFQIQVDTLYSPFAGNSMVTYLCQGTSGMPVIILADLLSGEGPGGVWSVASGSANPGANFDPIAGTLDPNGLATGTYIFAYKITTPTCGINSSNTEVHILNHPNATATTTPVSCTNPNGGTVNVIATSGTTPYQFNIGNGNVPGGFFSGLAEGTYAVTVTDANGCSVVVNATVGPPPNPLNVNCAELNPAFQGQNNGQAGITISNGPPNFVINWSGPSSGAKVATSAGLTALNNLGAGTYQVTVTASNGCSATCSFDIIAIVCALGVSAQATPVSCTGGNNGAISLDISNAVLPPQITWSNSAWNGQQNPGNATAGTYTVTVTIAAGCTTSTSVVVSQPQPMAINATITPISCAGSSNGTIQIDPVGGVGPYTTAWTPAQYNGATLLTPLPPGNYALTLTDANGCTKTQAFTLADPPGLQLGFIATSPPCAGQATGSILTNVSGGLPGYTYAWAPAAYSGLSDLYNLTAGTYALTVTDQHGCTKNGSVTLSPGASPVTTMVTQTTCDPLQAGTTQATLTGSNGCDSIVVLTRVLAPSDTTVLSAVTCNPAQAGVFTQILQNQYGCDSTLIINVSYDPTQLDTTYLAATTCNPQQAGVQLATMVGSDGCDSTIITTTSLLPADTVAVQVLTCHTAQAGVFTQVYPNQFGCDSIVTTTVVYDPTQLDTTLLAITTCDPQQAGVAFATLTGVDGCDSTVVTTTTFLPPDTTLLFAVTCQPAQAGVFTQVYPNQAGCDSMVTTTVVYDPTQLDTTLQSVVTCDPQQAGVAFATLTGVNGCDSTVVTTTTFLPPDTTLLFAVTCQPAQAGVFTQVYPNQAGCDSMVTTTVVYDPTQLDTTLLAITTCDPQQASVAFATLTGVDGCDSTVITTTTFLPPDTTLLFAVTCQPAQAGVFTQVYHNLAGCDSTVTTIVVYDPSQLDTTYLAITTCDLQQAGVAFATLTGVNGCDSTVVTTTTFLPPDTTLLFAVTCQPAQAGVFTQVYHNQAGCDSTVINTVVYNPGQLDTTVLFVVTCDPQQAGVTPVTLTGTDGCDSTVITTTIYSPLILKTSASPPLCYGDANGSIVLENSSVGKSPFQVSLNGQPYAPVAFPYQLDGLGPGQYIISILDGWGCVTTDTVQFLPPPALIVSLGPDIEINLGDSALLNPVLSFVPASFSWASGQAIPCPACLQQYVAPLETAGYELLAFDSLGCSASGALTVRVILRHDRYFPNVIKAGSSGLNDRFTIYADPSVRSIRQLRIYDRWGGLVFSREGFPPNDPGWGWDGRVHGQMAGPGVYAWWAELELQTGETEIVSGDVTVLRE